MVGSVAIGDTDTEMSDNPAHSDTESFEEDKDGVSLPALSDSSE